MASPIYSQISANKQRTVLLIAIFGIFVVGIGYVFGMMNDSGPAGVILAGTFATGSALVSYYSGDKVALWSSGARGPLSATDQPYLTRMVENLAITAGLPTPKAYVIDDPAINAFATGRDPAHASIAVTRGAIERLENEELQGVLAHELSHVKNYDIRVMTLVVVLVGTVAILANWFVRARFFGGRRGRDQDGVLPLFLVGLALSILAPIAAQLIQLAISRRREYLADASGALLTRFPDGLARALEKIAADNRPLASASQATAHLFISNPFGATRMANLFSTHPPIAERIRILRTMTSG